jgi:hypothetical protein
VVFTAGVGDRVKAGQRTTDAAHLESEKHADGPRRAAHHLIDQIVVCNEHGRLRPDRGR